MLIFPERALWKTSLENFFYLFLQDTLTFRFYNTSQVLINQVANT